MTGRLIHVVFLCAGIMVGLALVAYTQVRFLSIGFLWAAGYPTANVGSAYRTPEGVVLKSVSLGSGQSIGQVTVSGDFTDIVTLDWRHISLHLKDSDLSLGTPWGEARVRGDGTVVPHDGMWRWMTEAKVQSQYGRFSARITAELERERVLRAQVEIRKGALKLPGGVTARRMAGWVEVEDGRAVGGQVTLGVVEDAELRLLDATVTVEKDGTTLFGGTDGEGRRAELTLGKDGVSCNGAPMRDDGMGMDAARVMKLARACLAGRLE